MKQIYIGVIVLMFLTAMGCQTSPRLQNGEGGRSALGGIVVDVTGKQVFQANDPHTASGVELLHYVTRNNVDVKVLFGPNDGVNEVASCYIFDNGDLLLQCGFAYMNATGPAAATRPCIRTPRVRAAGEGTAWAVQIRQLVAEGSPQYDDRVFFIEKSACYVDTEPPSLNPLLTMNTQYRCISALTSPPNPPVFLMQMDYATAKPTEPTKYAARRFAEYVDGYQTMSGLPKMMGL